MSYQLKKKVKFVCDPTTLVVDREKNGDKCPFCGSPAEIFLWDFSIDKPTFDDLWGCRSRDCGKDFIMRTKRE